MTPSESTLDTLPAPLRARVERYWQTFEQTAAPADLRAATQPELLLHGVWACSDFVAQYCIRHPQSVAELLHNGDLRSRYSPGEYQHRMQAMLPRIETEQALSEALRELRQREMVRIAWRDLAGWADLTETLCDLSALAEAAIDTALQVLHRWQSEELGMPCDVKGAAQSLIVVGMGKLGAGELNFSSDVDLIFAYPEQGETRGVPRPISNEEYFTRLSRRLVHVLAAITAQGFVFRVDLRLRPFGESGPLALGFDAMEDYYQAHGREWERYAMIKARVVAGDRKEGEHLLAKLRPFVYRRYPDFGAIKALRDMKKMIAEEMRRKGMSGNIKLGAGGIREIEFIGQVFQLIQGGRDVELQERSILRVLDTLGSAQYLPAYVTRQLSAAYVFLRRVENRLQEAADQQTHTLPVEEAECARLALAMGYSDWNAFEQALRKHMNRVHGHFEQVFAAPQLERWSADGEIAGPDLSGLWQGTMNEAQAGEVLVGLNFNEPPEALRWLKHLREAYAYRVLSPGARERMDRLMPVLIAATGQSERPTTTLARLVRLVEAIARRTAYLALLAENPLALSQLVKLCAASPWIAGMLTRYPVLLDDLLDPRALYAPLDRAGLDNEMRQLLLRIPQEDLEQQMEALRHFKQVNVLRVAAADSLGALPLMIVSDYLTEIAEVVLREVLALGWAYLVARHGRPRCMIEGQHQAAGFAIVAYGKLGGIELSYGSDLDLVFLHDSGGGEQRTEGPKPIDNALFFARLGQRIIHMLNTPTPAGVLYAIDVRLRPSGASGLLVSSLESFADYQRTQAWTWEHQALVRARVVAEITDKTPAITPRFAKLRAEILMRKRDQDALRVEVRAMRERMRAALAKQERDMFDLKQDAGGIADIEFMVQYGALLWTHDHPELRRWTDNLRLLQGFAEAGRLAAQDAQSLRDAYCAYRAAVHRRTLQEEPARVSEGEFHHYRERVIKIWRDLLER